MGKIIIEVLFVTEAREWKKSLAVIFVGLTRAQKALVTEFKSISGCNSSLAERYLQASLSIMCNLQIYICLGDF